jgi:hypothetical protein
MHPDAITAEVEACPADFREELEKYVRSLGVGGPGWENEFLVGGIYYSGDMTPEQVAEMYEGISRKNRVTAEALLQYFQRSSEIGK